MVTLSDAPAWEVTLLRRSVGGHKAVVAARIEIQAPDLGSARQAAQNAVSARCTGEDRWSLGMLRPLTPDAPGTHRYRVVFAIWEGNDERFVRRDVHAIELWACDAQSARRQAQQDVQVVPGYISAWRVRSVSRIAAPPRPMSPKLAPRRKAGTFTR